MTTISDEVIHNIIRRLLNNENYRPEVTKLIDVTFFEQSHNFLDKVGLAKLNNSNNPNWYRDIMMNNNLIKDEIAMNAGINLKTIRNTFGNQKKETVIDASTQHYEGITNLINISENLTPIIFSVIVNENRVDFTTNESYNIINVLSTRKASIRGGIYSTAGKRVEKPLLTTLCRLLQVPEENYNQQSDMIPETPLREVDYWIMDDQIAHKCEVKLMGGGNPENADVLFARDTEIFVADRLSNINKQQLDEAGIKWTAMDDGGTLEQFADTLDHFGIQNTRFSGDLNMELERIFRE